MLSGAPPLSAAQKVVAFVPDLMDRSRVESAARAVGSSVEFVARPTDLPPAIARGATLVIIDLTHPGALDVLPNLRPARTVGFGSHVDGGLLRAARHAGCDEVLSRSVFFGRLSQPQWGSHSRNTTPQEPYEPGEELPAQEG